MTVSRRHSEEYEGRRRISTNIKNPQREPCGFFINIICGEASQNNLFVINRKIRNPGIRTVSLREGEQFAKGERDVSRSTLSKV